MNAKKILLVEDEKAIRDMIGFSLRRAGFTIVEAENCRDGRAALVDARPDLAIVDWMLPDQSGLEFTRQLKREAEYRDLPVIMLTARAEEGDKVAGLEGGADDYITKPFSPRELVARIQAVLRRAPETQPPGAPSTEQQIVEFGEFSLNLAARSLSRAGKPVALTTGEFALLKVLVQHGLDGICKGIRNHRDQVLNSPHTLVHFLVEASLFTSLAHSLFPSVLNPNHRTFKRQR